VLKYGHEQLDTDTAAFEDESALDSDRHRKCGTEKKSTAGPDGSGCAGHGSLRCSGPVLGGATWKGWRGKDFVLTMTMDLETSS
jgi:hypothetical protein